MNEMIERVAKAICPNDFNSLEGHKQGQCSYCDSQRDMVREQARRAIEAMREPTDEQRNKYFEMKKTSGYDFHHSVFIDAEWERMIDSCLDLTTPDPNVG